VGQVLDHHAPFHRYARLLCTGAIVIAIQEARTGNALTSCALVAQCTGVAIFARFLVGLMDAPLHRTTGVVGAGIIVVAVQEFAARRALAVYAQVPGRAGVAILT